MQHFSLIDMIESFELGHLDEILGGTEAQVRETITGTGIGSLPEEVRGRAGRIGASTVQLIERLAEMKHPFYVPQIDPNDMSAPNGWYWGHPILGGNMPRIIGSVYLGRKERDAIHIKVSENSGEIRRLFNKFLALRQTWRYWLLSVLAAEQGKVRFQHNLLQDVVAFVQTELPFNQTIVNELMFSMNLKHDKVVELDIFIQARGGVCRHQMCLLGALLELLQRGDYISGVARINRRHVPGFFAHAWVEYTDAAGNPWILDPAQNVCGKLSDLSGTARWFYGE